MDADRLKAIPLFRGLSKNQRERVSTWADEVNLEPGKHLVEQGEFAHEFFVIEEGAAEVTVDGDRVGALGPGDFFGEIALIYENARRTATVTASSPLRFFVLTRQSFRSLLEHQPEIEEKVMAALEDRLQSGS